MTERIIVGYDAKRIVRNATGLGSYGRTLVNDLSQESALAPIASLCARSGT